MTNGGIIEGHTEYSACSDLSLAIGYAALLNRTPTYIVGYLCRLSGASIPNVSMRVFHGAGTNDEENAGQHYAEKEARLRPQHYFPRGPMLETICTLLDQRLLVSPTRRCGSADVFGSGDCSFANASEGFKGWGADEVAPPRS